MKFKFESSFVGFGSPKNTIEFEVDHLDDVLMYFKQFLQGSGYNIDGVLEVIPTEEYYTYPNLDEPAHVYQTPAPEIDDDGRC